MQNIRERLENQQRFSLKVHVTASHIRRGKRAQTDFCPIALAIRAALPRQSGFVPEVRDDEVRLVNSVQIPIFQATNRKAENFVNRFDEKQKVKPVTMTLRFVPVGG